MHDLLFLSLKRYPKCTLTRRDAGPKSWASHLSFEKLRSLSEHASLHPSPAKGCPEIRLNMETHNSCDWQELVLPAPTLARKANWGGPGPACRLRMEPLGSGSIGAHAKIASFQARIAV